jgi:hypothetical protein
LYFSGYFSGGLNGWHIVELAPRKDNDSQEVEEANRLVVKSWADRAEETIKEGENRAFQTEDPNANGYYLVQWLGQPYQLEESCVLPEYAPPIFVPKGETVCDARYWMKVRRAPKWYTLSVDKTKVRLCQRLSSNVRLVEESEAEGFMLPKTCNRSQARRLQGRKVMSHESLLDEITRRDVIEFIEEEDDVLEHSDNSALVTSDEELDLDSSKNIVDDNE